MNAIQPVQAKPAPDSDAIVSRPAVTAVVLNWNGREPLQRTLDALLASSWRLHEVVVVDNGSTDGSVLAVRLAHPGVEVVALPENLGASEGRNVGIRRALEGGADYVFNIDNDIEVAEDAIDRLVRTAEENPDVGVVGTLICFRDDPTLIQNAGGMIRYRQNVHWPIGWRERNRGQFGEPFEVDMVGSGAMLTRREVFGRVEGFDAGYLGCQLDDTDFCKRVGLAGFRILSEPAAVVLHDFHFNHKYTYRRKYLESHNAVRFLQRYGGPVEWARYLFFALGGLPWAAFRQGASGNLSGVGGKFMGLADALLGREAAAEAVFRASE